MHQIQNKSAENAAITKCLLEPTGNWNIFSRQCFCVRSGLRGGNDRVRTYGTRKQRSLAEKPEPRIPDKLATIIQSARGNSTTKGLDANRHHATLGRFSAHSCSGIRPVTKRNRRNAK